MSDMNKNDDPTIIPEAELDAVEGGANAPNQLITGASGLGQIRPGSGNVSTDNPRLKRDAHRTGFNTGKGLD